MDETRFYKGLHRVLRACWGGRGLSGIEKLCGAGKRGKCQPCECVLQQLEYEAQTAAVRQVLPGLFIPGTSRKNQ